MEIKGLQNKGENNCFINVVVQILWNITEAREQIINTSHVHQEIGLCITCEISTLFLNMKYSDSTNFSTSSLRNVLTCLENSPADYKENSMGCAIETFEDILDRIHNESLQGDNKDCKNLCISHKYFGFQHCEEMSCCNDFVIGEVQNSCLLRVYANELERACSLITDVEKRTFSYILGTALVNSERKIACSECRKENRAIQRWISAPKILAISIIWDPRNLHFAKRLLRTLESRLYSRDIFYADPSQVIIEDYIFRGMICFQYSHYSTYMYSIEEKTWYQIDDIYIRKINKFSKIIEMMNSNDSVPVLLLYEEHLYTSSSPPSPTSLNLAYANQPKKKSQNSHYEDRSCFDNCRLY